MGLGRKHTHIPRAVVAFGIGFSVLLIVSIGVLSLPGLAFLFYHPAPGQANPLWLVLVVACTGGLLVLFGRAIVQTIRIERRSLLDGTKPIEDAELADTDGLKQSVERLAAQANVPTPTLRIHPTTAPLAYTTYRPTDPLFSSTEEVAPVLVVSTGLLDQLSETERDGVLAHEFVHMSNDDLWVMTWLLVPIVAAEEIQGEYDRPTSYVDFVGIVLSKIAVVGLGILSRSRELRADRDAAVLLGDTKPLIGALLAIEDGVEQPPTKDLRNRIQSTNAVSFVPALQTEAEQHGFRSTHPSVERRLTQLRSMELPE